jgi:hypothetical protein
MKHKKVIILALSLISLFCLLTIISGIIFFLLTNSSKNSDAENDIEENTEVASYPNETPDDIEPKEEKTGEELIREFYQNIKEKKFEEAYEFSTKSMSLQEFTDMYKDIDDIRIEKIEEKAKDQYYVEVTLTEGENKGTYYITMNLDMDEPDYHIINYTSYPSVILNSKCPAKEISDGKCYLIDKLTGEELKKVTKCENAASTDCIYGRGGYEFVREGIQNKNIKYLVETFVDAGWLSRRVSEYNLETDKIRTLSEDTFTIHIATINGANCPKSNEERFFTLEGYTDLECFNKDSENMRLVYGNIDALRTEREYSLTKIVDIFTK